jgi:hypothetical protein
MVTRGGLRSASAVRVVALAVVAGLFAVLGGTAPARADEVRVVDAAFTAPPPLVYTAGARISEFDLISSSAMVVGADGYPLIAYTDRANNDLIVVHCGNTVCSRETQTRSVLAEAVGEFGRVGSIAIGSDGFPIIAYTTSDAFTFGNRDLAVAHCSDTICSTARVAEFPTQIVASDGRDGLDAQIAIGSDGLPVIAHGEYIPSTRDYSRLWVTKCLDIECSEASTRLVGTNSAGYPVSIRVGTDGLPIILADASHFMLSHLIHCLDVDCDTFSDERLGHWGAMAMEVGDDGLPVVVGRKGVADDRRTVIETCLDPACEQTEKSSLPITSVDFPNYSPVSIGFGREGFPVVAATNVRINATVSSGSVLVGGFVLVQCLDRICSSSRVDQIEDTRYPGSLLRGSDGNIIFLTGSGQDLYFGVLAANRIAPSETRCVSTFVASPGELVGLNTTPVRASGRGFGTLHSSDVPAGNTSNVNYDVGSVDPNFAFVRVGRDGKVCFTNGPTATVDVVIDVLTVADSDSMSDLSTGTGAARLVDTRQGLGGGRLAASETRCFQVAGGVADGQRVGVNVTPVLASERGFGTIHAPSVSAGATSTVNYMPASVDPNFAFAQVGDAGKVCFTNGPGATVDLVVDQLVVAAEGLFREPTDRGAERLVDTRVALGGTRLAGSETRCVDVVGASRGVSEYVGVNVTVVGASGTGFGAVHASGAPVPRTSNVNYAPGSIDPNFATTRVGNDGKICFTNGPDATVDLILDEVSVASDEMLRDPTSPGGAVRILDTRVRPDGRPLPE